MRRILPLLVCVLLTSAAAQQRPRTLLAVFAHPDDETSAGPVLARYAREGVKVYLAITTDGAKGVREHAGIAAGEPLAKARRQEAACAARELGMQAPIFYDLADGELGAITKPIGLNLVTLAERLRKTIAELKPDVLVTWGVDGGSGHPDHRLVSSVVTEVFQAGGPDWPRQLYYVGLPGEAPQDPGGFRTVEPRYLTIRVAFTAKDFDSAVKAFSCHKTQFTPEEMKGFSVRLRTLWGEALHFRAYYGVERGEDLFAR